MGADELRAEQDHASAQASSKQSLNNQLGQLEGRLADAENAAAKGGKAAMSKLENKIRELEAELAGTQARTGEAGKAYQRAERKCKELVFSSGEDKKNQDRMTDLASKLQSISRPTSSRSRRPRRSPPSTWLSSGRPSRSWRRLRARQARCPSLIRGNRPNKKAQLNLEKNLNKLLDEAMLEATKVASQRTPEHLILIIVPHPLQLPSGRAPWFISMSAGT